MCVDEFSDRLTADRDPSRSRRVSRMQTIALLDSWPSASKVIVLPSDCSFVTRDAATMTVFIGEASRLTSNARWPAASG